MDSYKTRIIDERSKIIPIVKNLSTLKNTNNQTQYDLKENMFDPSKSSPPNDFMLKLNMRMSIYDSNSFINDAVRKRV